MHSGYVPASRDLEPDCGSFRQKRQASIQVYETQDIVYIEITTGIYVYGEQHTKSTKRTFNWKVENEEIDNARL